MDDFLPRYIECLNADILYQNIFPYLDRLSCLINLSHTSKGFRNLIFSQDCSGIWSCGSLDICIDPQCRFGCGRQRIKPTLAYKIIEETDVVELRLHLPFHTFGNLQNAILRNWRQSLRHLHLRFRRVDEGLQIPPTEDNMWPAAHSLLSFSPNQNQSKPHAALLNSLVVYGWPVENPLSCLNLSTFGGSLEVLHFMETSPRHLLRKLHSDDGSGGSSGSSSGNGSGDTRVCPHLTDLCIQGEQDMNGITCFSNGQLKVLALRDAAVFLSNVAPLGAGESMAPPCLDLPSLYRLELIDHDHVLLATEDDVRSMVAALPPLLREIELRLNSSLANCVITQLSKRLRYLEVLSLHLPDEDDLALPINISRPAIESLAACCPSLLSLEVTDGLISFDLDAFEALGSLSSLRRLKMMYDEDYVDLLPTVLNASQSIEEVLFYDNADDVADEDPIATLGGASRWHEMSESLAKVAEMFPSVNLGLRDSWWL